MSRPPSSWCSVELERCADALAAMPRRPGEHPAAWRRAELRIELARIALALAPVSRDVDAAQGEALAAVMAARHAVGDIAADRFRASRAASRERRAA